ncbi:hypothetical protein AAFF_G00199750 [Aldrovandia affinis]|uniref:Uncharacterized protein n=1 Tax=Aldrovandia affinis TaxID=143900 RepID=A0AAD7W5Z9_9TELE|nr:hypothetical protein AAFF_G00199750 [Aldrovandia affinis]
MAPGVQPTTSRERRDLGCPGCLHEPTAALWLSLDTAVPHPSSRVAEVTARTGRQAAHGQSANRLEAAVDYNTRRDLVVFQFGSIGRRHGIKETDRDRGFEWEWPERERRERESDVMPFGGRVGSD